MAEATLNMATVFGHLWPQLHATNSADAVWWSETELLAWVNQAFRKLARASGTFVERVTQNSAAGTRTYTHASDHVATLHVTYDGAALRPASVLELLALDDSWQSQGAVARWYQEGLGVQTLGLARVPAAIKQIAVIQRHTVSAAAANSFVAAPEVVGLYLEAFALGEAYGKECDAAQLDVAMALREFCGVLDQAFAQYYGAGI